VSSLAHQVIAEEKREAGIAEEMRILYVATTRARERLILTACENKKNCLQILTNGAALDDAAISEFQLKNCNKPLQWLLYGLSDQKILHEAFGTQLDKKFNDDKLIDLEIYEQSELGALSGYVDDLKKAKPQTPKAKASSKQKQVEDWTYDFIEAAHCPAKTSVTTLTHHNDEHFKADHSQALTRKPKAVLTDKIESQDKGKLIGTATHLIMAEIDLNEGISEESIEKTKADLIARGRIDSDIAKHITAKSIMSFFESDLGKLAVDRSNRIMREWPFSFAMPGCEWDENAESLKDESIIVQGIADLLIETADGIVLVDFKTDRISKSEVDKRAESYAKQLELYGLAAESILNKKVIGKWLYFMTVGCEFEIRRAAHK